MRYAASSTYTLEYPVSDFEDGSSLNVTTFSLDTAVGLADGSPDNLTWVQGVWRTDPATTPTTYWAQLTIGPAKNHVLEPGRYMVYLRISGEVTQVGLIEVY